MTDSRYHFIKFHIEKSGSGRAIVYHEETADGLIERVAVYDIAPGQANPIDNPQSFDIPITYLDRKHIAKTEEIPNSNVSNLERSIAEVLVNGKKTISLKLELRHR